MIRIFLLHTQFLDKVSLCFQSGRARASFLSHYSLTVHARSGSPLVLRTASILHALPSVGIQSKASPLESGFRMVSCDKIKRDKASVASPVPFEIPTRLFVSRIPRTGFLPDAADARVVSAFG